MNMSKEWALLDSIIDVMLCFTLFDTLSSFTYYFYINFINLVLYNEYIYMNALCKLNKILSMTRTLLLDHYRMSYYRSY